MTKIKMNILILTILTATVAGGVITSQLLRPQVQDVIPRGQIKTSDPITPVMPVTPIVPATPAASAKSVKLNVPFTSQAPHKNWDMPYQEACEEASIIMAAFYLNNEGLDADIADTEILKLVAYEEANGLKVDIGAADSGKVAEAVYGLKSETLFGANVTEEKIKSYIDQGLPVIIPAAGRELANPNYSGLGPVYHMIIIIGYDENGFITHDPGTQAGNSYHYSFATIMEAIHDWTNDRSIIQKGEKAMLVLSK